MDLNRNFFEKLDAEYAHKRKHLRHVGSLLRHFPLSAPADSPKIPAGKNKGKTPRPEPLSWDRFVTANKEIARVEATELHSFLSKSLSSKTAIEKLTALFTGEKTESTASPDGITAFARAEIDFVERNKKILAGLPAGKGDTLDFDSEVFIAELKKFKDLLKRDVALYRRFRNELNKRGSHNMKVNVIGQGEIADTIEVVGNPHMSRIHPETGKQMPLVYKRMPVYETIEETLEYMELYHRYNNLLHDETGINVPSFDSGYVRVPGGGYRVYVMQERLPAHAIASTLIRKLDTQNCILLHKMVLGEYKKVFEYNRDRDAGAPELGLDGQIPNWCVLGAAEGESGITGDEKLIYLDTNTPMIRENGEFLLNTDIFLREFPLVLRLATRVFFLKQILDRYFSPGEIIMDLLASYIVFDRRDLLDELIEVTNEYVAKELQGFGIPVYTNKKVMKYHKNDVLIWKVTQMAKKRKVQYIRD